MMHPFRPKKEHNEPVQELVKPWINSDNNSRIDGADHTSVHPVHQQTSCKTGSSNDHHNKNIQSPSASEQSRANLENITNSRNDFVGNAQLCMTDQVPSFGMDGTESKSCFIPYMLLSEFEKASLQ